MCARAAPRSDSVRAQQQCARVQMKMNRADGLHRYYGIVSVLQLALGLAAFVFATASERRSTRGMTLPVERVAQLAYVYLGTVDSLRALVCFRVFVQWNTNPFIKEGLRAQMVVARCNTNDQLLTHVRMRPRASAVNGSFSCVSYV
jgi:hypothetical protein